MIINYLIVIYFFVLKIRIVGLQKKSEKHIIRTGKINPETACNYFILADQHNARLLKDTALDFISE